MKIIVADDHSVVRRGVKDILLEEFAGVVIGEACDASGLLDLVSKTQWDIAVMDLTMPGRSGLEALREVKQLAPHLPILVLSMHPEDQFAVRSIRAGASGYLTKESLADELVRAIMTIRQGGKYIRPSVAELLAAHVQRNEADEPLYQRLSDREFQVLRLLTAGKSVTEIAQALGLSVKTISTYRVRILEKLQLKTDTDLTRYAVSHRLIE